MEKEGFRPNKGETGSSSKISLNDLLEGWGLTSIDVQRPKRTFHYASRLHKAWVDPQTAALIICSEDPNYILRLETFQFHYLDTIIILGYQKRWGRKEQQFLKLACKPPA